MIVTIQFLQILKQLADCTFQTTFGYVCSHLCVGISLHFISGVNIIYCSGFGFAYICVNMFLMPIGIGLNSSLNMHTAQAIGLKHNMNPIKYFQLNVCLIFAFMFPLGLILYQLKDYLTFLLSNQDRDETSQRAWEYLLYLIPATIINLEFECIKSFMIANKITYPFTLIHLLTTLFHIFINWFLLQYYQLGSSAIGFTIIFTEVLNLLGILIIIYQSDLKQTLFREIFVKQEFNNKFIYNYLKTTTPFILHLYFELGFFYFLSFVAVTLGTESMNANLAILNTIQIIYRFPIGLSFALVSFIGTQMGKRDIIQAKLYLYAAIILLVLTELVFVSFLSLFKHQWIEFYAQKNKDLSELLDQLFPWMLYGVVITDGTQGTLNGALKGINRIDFVFFSTLIAYYFFCIPLVFIFTYDWGLGHRVVGIWQAFGLANLVLFILYAISLLITDWQMESDKIIQRIANQHSITQNGYENEFSSLEMKIIN